MSLRPSRTKAAVHLSSLTAALLIALLLAACSNPMGGSDPSTQATIDALAAANAQLSTQVADLSAAAGLATPTPAAAAPAPSESTSADAAAASAAVSAEAAAPAAAPIVAQPGAGSLPQLLAEVPLAPSGETLYDLRLDRAANRLFVTDSADQLHVLDATTYETVAVLPYGGWLQLDSDHNRLYVYKPYITQEESLIRVIDTTTLEEVGSVPGRALAIDSARNRLFVGEPYVVSLEQDAPGVRMIDGATLQQTGVFTQSGAPTYNPLRDELLIAAYTVYSADPETQQVTGDLFPELTDLGEGGFLWCNGCYWVDDIQYFTTEQLVAVAVSRHCTGAGCGQQDAPRFFDANTMQPLAAATAPQVQADCGSQANLVNAVGGRRYVNQIYTRYVVFNNLLVTDEAGAPLTQRDGLRIDYVNARTGQGYLYDGTVIDLATLTPIGRWPAACLMAEEFAGESVVGRLYGYREGNLYVIAERGGELAAPPAPAAEPLPTEWTVRQIAVSPDYAADSTLLAVSGAGIYRSTDAGANWQRLRGGLPEGQGSNWTVAFSPGFAADRTIFAGGDRGEYWGEGVWRSTDGGESWGAQWQDLVHRRVSSFYLAPGFSTAAGSGTGSDQTVVVQAKYYDIAAGEGGDSYQQSTDGGLSWTVVATGSLSSGEPDALPPISELLPGYVAPPALPARLGDLHDAVQVTLDGSTWITAPLPLPEGEWFYALLPVPTYPDDPTLYALGNLSLWRSSDGGGTWSAWEDARLDGLDYTNEMSAAAVSPLLADGGHRLFMGTADGQVWVLDPAQMEWGEPVAAAPQAASVAAAVTTTPAAPAATAATSVTATAAVTPATTSVAATTVEATGVVTSTAAVTPTSAVTSTAAITGTAAVTEATPTPAATAEPLAGEPPAGLFRPQGSLGIVWQANARIQQDLGWARQETPATAAGAYQLFDGGVMVWRGDTSQIFAFLNDGTWQSFADTFEEGDPESDPSFKPPGGKQQPIRGFGKVWREHAALREQLGWALAKEQAQQAEVQPFERGQMLRYGGLVFTVIGVDTDSGRWY